MEFPIRSRLPPRAEAAAERSAPGWDATRESARLGGFEIAAGGQKNITGCLRWHRSSVKGRNDRHTCSWIPAQAAVDLSALLFTVVPFLFFFFISLSGSKVFETVQTRSRHPTLYAQRVVLLLNAAWTNTSERIYGPERTDLNAILSWCACRSLAGGRGGVIYRRDEAVVLVQKLHSRIMVLCAASLRGKVHRRCGTVPTELRGSFAGSFINHHRLHDDRCIQEEHFTSNSMA